jgi:transcriptional regulator with XRE-family HTH domain
VATEFGCHQTVISRIEQGERELRAHELFEFARLYGTTPEILISPYTEVEEQLERELAQDGTYDHTLLPRRRWRRGQKSARQ